MFKKLRLSIGNLWCSLAHRSVMWPVHGYYACRTCGRCYPAFGAAPSRVAASVMLAAALAFSVGAAHGAGKSKGHANADAEAVLARFIGAAQTDPWTTESVEIHACLTKLEKTGQLRAIRHQASPSQSNFTELQFAGDRAVKEQVIIRYLKINEREPAGPAADVAMTPANYRFTYKGLIDDGEHFAYAFEISPRHKREGLIKGELWLDPRTAVPVHESGRLVKSPAASVSRVSISRENRVRDGVIESRLTHINCQARRLGKAELVVEELPVTQPVGE